MEPTVLAVIMVAVLLLVLLSIFFCCLCIPKCLLHQHKVVSCPNLKISISYLHHQQRCTNSFYINFTITQFEKVPIPHLTPLVLIDRHETTYLIIRIPALNVSASPVTIVVVFQIMIQVNLCQKLSFFHHLTHNIATNCSLNYKFNT